MKAFDTTTEARQEEVEAVLAEYINALNLNNKAQIAMAERMNAYLEIEDKIQASFKKDINELTAFWKLADKNLKVKNDKTWGDLSRGDKQLETALQNYTAAKEQLRYFYDNISWLQERFPEAKYQDVVGLCKIADASEYAEEQDYSLNAGRYVGVEIEDDKITKEEFLSEITDKRKHLKKLNEEAKILENEIIMNLNQFVNE